jgi:UDP-GlcNAc:undecaprenyl-phosphate GlcNAc-1-phosphate transferase
MIWLVAICIAHAIAASLVLVPLLRASARALGLVDHPDGERKLHAEPVALGGGLAIFLALNLAFVATIWIDRAWFGRSLGDVSSSWYVLFAAAGAMLLLGLADDAWKLRGRQKLLLQCLIIVVLVGSGTVIREVRLLGVLFELGVFAFPLTVLWLLVAVNALNLIDGADGMATTAGSIICLGLGFLSMLTGNWLSGVVGFALAGALFGFLVFNRPPASIYLGDAGSMMIGLFVGVLAVWSNFKESTVLASAPIAILAIPLFDSMAAVLRRWLTGRSIYATDRAHLHHLLLEKYGNGMMLVLVAALCTTTTTLAVLSVRFEQPWLAGAGVAIVFAALVLTRSFGHAECLLLMGRAAHFAQSFATSPAHCDVEKQHRQVPLQGIGRWDTIWEPLVEFARSHELVKVSIDLSLAWLHEGYHANWQSVRLPEREFQLIVSVPLLAHRRQEQSPVQIGRLEVISAAYDPDVYHWMADLSDRLAELAPQIDQIVAQLELRKLHGVERPVSILSGASERSETIKAPLESVQF